MVCRGVPWCVMVCRGVPWNAVVCRGVPWFGIVERDVVKVLALVFRSVPIVMDHFPHGWWHHYSIEDKVKIFISYQAFTTCKMIDRFLGFFYEINALSLLLQRVFYVHLRCQELCNCTGFHSYYWQLLVALEMSYVHCGRQRCGGPTMSNQNHFNVLRMIRVTS